MRLINTSTLDFYEIDISKAPPFAILSHTWGDDEVTYEDMRGHRAFYQRRRGFQKISRFCLKAAQSNLEYGWVDTCCIDKRSSAELSEAINSMYRYYAMSAVCYIYLSDVSLAGGEHMVAKLKASRWFTRGWTLQELIAPCVRQVFDMDWAPITHEKGDAGMAALLALAAGVPYALLQQDRAPAQYCVAERMSWAARRETAREEDMAYCLMGLFDVHMATIYGEGGRKAFRRLQMEIMQASFDQTMFAWRGSYPESGLLARSPADFQDSWELSLWGPRYLSPFTMTNVGLSVQLADATARLPAGHPAATLRQVPEGTLVAMMQCDIRNTETRKWQGLAIYLQPVTNAAIRINGSVHKAYRRILCEEWCPVPLEVSNGAPFFDCLVLEDEHHALVLNAREADVSRFKMEFSSSSPDVCERGGYI